MDDKKTTTKKHCGIVMPISECDGRPESHWRDVLSIVSATSLEAGFETRLVSDTMESNLIHKEILQNIYNDDLIICDVSGMNPNVYFELGIRMATQRPTVIIKDDKTAYPFDTGPNRYIEYPRDLRHPRMEEFKTALTKSIEATMAHGMDKSFIGQLGPFKIPEIESTSVPADIAMLDRLIRIEKKITQNSNKEQYHIRPHIADNISRHSPSHMNFNFEVEDNQLKLTIKGIDLDSVERGIHSLMSRDWDFDSIETTQKGPLHHLVSVNGICVDSSQFQHSLESAIRQASIY